MQKRKQNGFTLVELVVVIAVLAILAGVGAVAYSGYIEKANEAHDLALLSAVNTAFQAAYTEEELTTYPKEAEAKLEGDEGALKLTDLTAKNENGTEEISGFFDVFKKYYEGNEEAVFKVYKGLKYGVENGVFSGVLNDGTIILTNGWKMTAESTGDGYTIYTVTDGDGNERTYKVNDAAVQAFQDSAFGPMGAGEVIGRVGDCASGAAATFGLLGARNLLGTAELEEFQKYISEKGYTDKSAEYNNALANAVVMNIAELSKGLTQEEVINVIKGNMPLGTTAGGKIVAKAATAYGVLTAWAHDPVHKDEKLSNGQTAEQYWNYLAAGLTDEDQLPTIRGEVAQRLATPRQGDGSFVPTS